MFKHIFGQAAYQLSILFLLVFYGNFIKNKRRLIHTGIFRQPRHLHWLKHGKFNKLRNLVKLTPTVLLTRDSSRFLFPMLWNTVTFRLGNWCVPAVVTFWAAKVWITLSQSSFPSALPDTSLSFSILLSWCRFLISSTQGSWKMSGIPSQVAAFF